MALIHQRSDVPILLAPLAEGLRATKTHALLKAGQLELVRIVLRAGQHMPEHRVDGEITVLCIEGCIDFTTSSTTHRLSPGQLLHLGRNEPHALRGVEDASALLTICLPPTSS